MENIKQKALDKDGVATAETVESEYQNIPKNDKIDKGKKETLKKQAMQIRSKAKGRRCRPNKLKEVILDNEAHYIKDDKGNLVEIVASDSDHMDRNRMIIFCPKDNIEKLSTYEQMLSDGTFCTTDGFKQVLILPYATFAFKTPYPAHLRTFQIV